MTSPSAGPALSNVPGVSSSLAAPGRVTAGAPADTTQLDRLCEKALSAGLLGRDALAASLYRRAADEALQLYGKTFVCTFLTLFCAHMLTTEARRVGVARAQMEAEAWSLITGALPLISKRMDDNTMLPGRGMAVELGFCKKFAATKHAVVELPQLSAANLQLQGLSSGYATACSAACLLLECIVTVPELKADPRLAQAYEAFILRVVDNMQPAARSLHNCYTLAEELSLARRVDEVLARSGSFHATSFLASLRSKWAAMEKMRRVRLLLHRLDEGKELNKELNAVRLADVTAHGFKKCALPLCDEREVSVLQFRSCSACRSVWYCSPEHGVLHWKEHKPVCRATAAAKEAAAGRSGTRD